MNKIWWVKPGDLDDDQRKVLGLPLTGRHVILGPPGSGKSTCSYSEPSTYSSLEPELQNHRVHADPSTFPSCEWRGAGEEDHHSHKILR